MIATWMLYAIAFGALIIAASAALDRAARANRFPTRFIWVAALVVGVVLPFVMPWIGDADRLASAQGVTAGQPIALDTPVKSKPSVIASLLPRLRELGMRIDRPLAIGWMLLTALLLGRVLFATITLWRQRAHWVEREIDGVPLFVTPDLGPAVVAIPDTRIIVPEWVLSLDTAALSTVIRHERQHSAAGDPRLILAGSLAAALLPWNPALWYIRRRLRLAVEMDCDARVLSEDPRVDRYGSLLLAIAQHPRLAPQLSATLTESTSDLERRIDAMTSRPPKQPRLRAVLFASLAVAAITFACTIPAPDMMAPRSTEPVAAMGQPLTVGDVLFDFQVETPASMHPGNMPPSYPPQLRAANISGSVTARFVVDTNGHADMSTFTLVKSDHDAFTAAVREALASLKFYPARVGDRRVKQLVSMPFTFSLVHTSMAVKSKPDQPPPAKAVFEGSVEGDHIFSTQVVQNAPPVYPSELRAANVEGQVTASFVVKPDGSVDMSSVVIEKSSHDLFTASVRKALESMKLDPTGGRTRMPFMFSLAR